MKFLVPRAWTVFWEADANTPLRNLKQRFDAEPDLENRIIGSPEQYRQFIRELEQAERLRTGMALRQCLDEWFCVSEESARFWGFKEIMNGAAHRHDWDVYDYLFPQAHWLHIVRHPLHQVRAAARLSNSHLTSETAAEFLGNWLSIFNMSRKRAVTGRYTEIRYEDLVKAPKTALTPVLDQLGLKIGRAHV